MSASSEFQTAAGQNPTLAFGPRRVSRQPVLAAPAEALLCLAALAEAENSAPADSFGLLRRVPREQAALRSHALRRSHAQFKSDNSSKV